MIIIVAVVVLFFGGKKLTELARGMGRFTGEFKKGKADMERELRETQKDIAFGDDKDQNHKTE